LCIYTWSKELKIVQSCRPKFISQLINMSCIYASELLWTNMTKAWKLVHCVQTTRLSKMDGPMSSVIIPIYGLYMVQFPLTNYSKDESNWLVPSILLCFGGQPKNKYNFCRINMAKNKTYIDKKKGNPRNYASLPICFFFCYYNSLWPYKTTYSKQSHFLFIILDPSLQTHTPLGRFYKNFCFLLIEWQIYLDM
jgi:hypothetical protein